MKLCKKNCKEIVGYFYLDSIDWVNKNNGLDNFMLPDKTEFTSIKELINYAIELIPNCAFKAFASFHFIKCGVVKTETALLMNYKDDGSVQTFKC